MSKAEYLPGDNWADLSSWWLDELRDPAYDEVVTPLLVDVLYGAAHGEVVADLGCGNGRVVPRVAEALGGTLVGIELVEDLARLVDAPVAVAQLPSIPFSSDSLGGAYAVLVLEHLDDHEAFFAETARVVRPGGFLAVVSNHPVWTAPGSTPIADHDGEILWRPGRYFDSEAAPEPAGDFEVVFHHRSMAEILNAAASTGWDLQLMVERPHHDEGADPGVPRLVGIRWARRKRPASMAQTPST